MSSANPTPAIPLPVHDIDPLIEHLKGSAPREITRSGCVIAGCRVRAANGVSGDFADCCPGPDGIHFILGDAVGHGLYAGFLGLLILDAWRTAVEEGLGPTRTHRHLRRTADRWEAGRFATAIFGTVSQDGKRLRVVNAGHPYAWLRSAGDRKELPPTAPMLSPDLPAGVEVTKSFALAPGARLDLVTDGVLEARSASGQRFGVERTDRALSGPGGVSDRMNRLFGAVRDFRGASPPEDDMSVLLLRVLEGVTNAAATGRYPRRIRAADGPPQPTWRFWTAGLPAQEARVRVPAAA